MTNPIDKAVRAALDTFGGVSMAYQAAEAALANALGVARDVGRPVQLPGDLKAAVLALREAIGTLGDVVADLPSVDECPEGQQYLIEGIPDVDVVSDGAGVPAALGFTEHLGHAMGDYSYALDLPAALAATRDENIRDAGGDPLPMLTYVTIIPRGFGRAEGIHIEYGPDEITGYVPYDTSRGVHAALGYARTVIRKRNADWIAAYDPAARARALATIRDNVM